MLTLALGAANLGRGVMALRYFVLLPDLPVAAPLSYLAAMGGFWGIVFLVCTAGLSCFRQWARRSTLAAVTLYHANLWSNRLLLDASEYARRIYPLELVVSLILLLVFWGSLNIPTVRRVFREDNRRGPAR
jgi:hypothetical protein